MAKVLIVEDDLELLAMIKDWLSHEHYQVEAMASGREGQDALRFYEYDVVVLDWALPEVSGLEILQDFRNSGGKTPILMLTGKKTIGDKELGLDSGADDYLTKPFQMKELSARLRALLRRTTVQPANILKAGDLTLDSTSFRVTKGGEDLYLQRKEFAILEYMMRNPNRVFSPEALLERVWPSESESTVAALRTCMKRLRKKIAKEGEDCVLRTVHGVGYKLESP